MLAATIKDREALAFPLFASPKLDGIRAIVKDGVVLSRKLLPIPNQYVQELFGKEKYEGLDGELIVGSPTSPSCFKETTKGVMTEKGTPNVVFYVFDKISDKLFTDRLSEYNTISEYRILPVTQILVMSFSELEKIEEKWLHQGYEGVILRWPPSPYKFGRSTLKEGYLMKLKRFEDSEAKIIGFVAQMHNANEAKEDALGHKERSSHKANLVPKDNLGSLIVRDIKTQKIFNIGSGFDDETRKEIWENQGRYINKIVKYKFFPIGVDELPRFPIYLGIRSEIDY